MLPDPAALEHFVPTERLTATARPANAFREELRRIPNVRNALAVASVYAQTIGIVVAAVWFDNLVVWALAFILMGRAHAQFARGRNQDLRFEHEVLARHVLHLQLPRVRPHLRGRLGHQDQRPGPRGRG